MVKKAVKETISLLGKAKKEGEEALDELGEYFNSKAKQLSDTYKQALNSSNAKVRNLAEELNKKYDVSEVDQIIPAFMNQIKNRTSQDRKGNLRLTGGGFNQAAKDAADELNDQDFYFKTYASDIVNDKDFKILKDLDNIRSGEGGRKGVRDEFVNKILDEATQYIRVANPNVTPSMSSDFMGTLGDQKRLTQLKAGAYTSGIATGGGATALGINELLSDEEGKLTTKQKNILKKYEDISSNSSSVTDIRAGTMDKAFSMATKNPSKYIFINEEGLPSIIYKGEEIPANLATNEKKTEIMLVPIKKAMGGMMYNKGSLVGNQSLLDKDNDGEITGKDFAILNRTKKQKGSLLKMPYAEGGDVDEGADVEEKPSYSAGKKEQTGGGGGGEIGGSSFDPMAGVDPMEGVQTSADLMSEPGGRGSRVGLAFDRVANIGRNAFNNLSATGFNAVNTALKAVDKIPGGTEALAYYSMFGPTGARAAFGLEAFDTLRDRITKQEGSLMVPPEMESDMPMDTYPNIPPEEMAEAEASQLPDAEMEDKYMDFVLDQSLDDDEQSYLMNALEDDPKLSQIFDKVITTASEFTGAGEVEGPGTGVSDSIPARLSDGEFVFTKKATDQIGAGNLQRMMDDAERAFDGGMMRESKRMGGMMMKDEDPDLMEAMSNEDINRQMLMSNRAPSLLGTN